MPDPAAYDNEDDWMGACVPARREEHPDEDQGQSVAICLNMWRNKSAEPPCTRAYSLLEIKAIDAEKREIEGIASTPSVDRIGDILESKGARFTLPMPLLWQHKHDQPVGHVTAAKASDGGITIKAKFARVEEPGELKNLLDKAWQSVKAGLVRGLSVGFKPIEYNYMDEGGGIRFLEWSWYELSLVTIPANTDATISIVKSIDEQTLADGASASRDRVRKEDRSSRDRVSTSVNLKREGRSMSKTVGEQIADLEASRQAKSARMVDVMQKGMDEGRSTDEAEQEEFDTLEREVEAIDGDLKRLRVLERHMQAQAKPVTKENTATVKDAADVRTGQVRVTSPKLEPGIRFARLVKCLGMAQGNRFEAYQIAKANYPDDGGIQNILEVSARFGEMSSDIVTRAASGGMMTGHSLGSGLVGDETQVFADFVDWLRPQTVLGRFGTDGIPALRRVPFRTALISATSGATGYWVGEGSGKPVTNFDAERTHLEPLKSAAIAVCTKELIRDSSPSADALVRDELGNAIRQRVNETFIDPTVTAVAGISPASIANGANTQASSGTDADAVRLDIANLLNAYIVANNPPDTGVLIMTSARAMMLGLMRNALGQQEFPGISLRGGVLEGIPVLTTQLVPDTGSPAFGYVIMVNASDIWLAEEGGLMVSMSQEASIEMSTTPTQHVGGVGSPDTPIASTMVSLWQTNSVGFLVEWTINWMRRRTSGVQVLTGVAWRPSASA